VRSERSYLLSMHLCAYRRWLAVLAVVALILGLAGQGVVAADIGAPIAAASAEMPISQSGDAPGDEAAPEVVCYGVHCHSIGILSHSAPIAVVAFRQLNAPMGPAQLSRHPAPDPYPPRPVALS